MIVFPNYRKLIPNLLEFGPIRIQKLLHMSQNALFTTIIAFFAGVGADNIFKGDINQESKVVSIVLCLAQLILVIILFYYCRKLIKFVPFILRFTKSYNPYYISKDGERLVGSLIALSAILISTQGNMRKRIDKIRKNIE